MINPLWVRISRLGVLSLFFEVMILSLKIRLNDHEKVVRLVKRPTMEYCGKFLGEKSFFTRLEFLGCHTSVQPMR